MTKINEHEFELHNAHCFKIDVPQIGPAQAIYYDVAALADDDEKLVNWYKEKGLTKKDYYLVVGRFVPENSFEVMIREFMKSKSKKNFAIITNVNEKFLNELEENLHFKSDKRIKFVGTVYDQELLKKIRENAYAYFHGHTVGGTNPSLIDRLLKFAGKDNFQLDSTIGVGYILRQCWKYGWMMVRGRFFSIGYNQIANSVFIGKKVKVIEKKHLAIGEKTKLQDGVYIDALSREGVFIGENVVIGRNTRIECTGGLQSVGKGVKIGNRTTFGKFWNLFIPSADYIFDNHSAERQGAADSTGYD